LTFGSSGSIITVQFEKGYYLMSGNVARIEDLVDSFNNAVRNPDNLLGDGSVNWNFVDADIHMDAGEAGLSIPEEWFEMYDHLANVYEKAIV